MPAAPMNLLIEAGATFTLDLLWQDEDATPIDLTGYDARMQVRASAASSQVLLDLVSPTQITLGGAAGTIAVRAAATMTDTLAPGLAVYDLEMYTTDPAEVTRLIEGTVRITPQVTRA